MRCATLLPKWVIFSPKYGAELGGVHSLCLGSQVCGLGSPLGLDNTFQLFFRLVVL